MDAGYEPYTPAPQVPSLDNEKDRKAQYDAEVERLIAEKYSHGKEIEVNREHDSKPERFAEYLAYIEECKARAKEKLTNGKEVVVQ